MTGRGKGEQGLGKEVPSATGRCCATTSRAPSRLSGAWPSWRCQANFWPHLWRNPRSSKGFPWKCNPWRCTYTVHAKRKTVTALDVVYALKRQGRTLYGFGGWASSGWLVRASSNGWEPRQCSECGLK